MSSPGVKEDPRCAVTSAKKLREAGLLHGGPSSSGPWGRCVPRGARRAQASGGDLGEQGNKSDAPTGVATPELGPMVAIPTCSPSEKSPSDF